MTKDPSITTLSSREVYRNHWMRVREDEILRSNGQRGIYGVVEKEDGAIIIPIDVDQTGCERIWLVEQYRYTIQERVLELPQGAWERAIDNPEELARGELKEETGLEASRVRTISRKPSPAPIVFDHTGKCVFRGSLAAVGPELHEIAAAPIPALAGMEFHKLGDLAAAMKKGETAGSVIKKGNRKLLRRYRNRQQGKYIVDQLTAYGKKEVEQAKALADTDLLNGLQGTEKASHRLARDRYRQFHGRDSGWA